MKPRGLITGATALWALGVMFLSVAFPGVVAAASIPTSFDVNVGSKCVFEFGAANSSFTFVWKSAGGGLVTRHSVSTDENGFWRACAKGHVLTTGDTLKAMDGTNTHVFTVPRMTLIVNRVHDTVLGKAPAGATVGVYCQVRDALPTDEGCGWQTAVVADDLGNWSVQFPSDLTGGARFFARWDAPDGDRVSVFAQAGSVQVELGSPSVTGAYRANAKTKVVLYDGSMQVKAIARVTGDAFDGTFTGKFRATDGSLVQVEPGDTVAGGVASDSYFVVPAIDAMASAATDEVAGQCANAVAPYDLSMIRLYRTGLVRGWAVEPAVFDFNFRHVDWVDPVNVRLGDRIVVSCPQTDFDWVILTIHAE